MDTEYLKKMKKHLNKPVKKPPILPPNKLFKSYKNSHKMPDGSVMSGKKHTKKSKVIKKGKKRKTKSSY